jgi:hypothetical protein
LQVSGSRKGARILFRLSRSNHSSSSTSNLPTGMLSGDGEMWLIELTKSNRHEKRRFLARRRHLWDRKPTIATAGGRVRILLDTIAAVGDKCRTVRFEEFTLKAKEPAAKGSNPK